MTTIHDKLNLQISSLGMITFSILHGALVVAAATGWLLDGGYLGSICAGVFAGLLMLTPNVYREESAGIIGEVGRGVTVVLTLALYWWKVSTMMPSDWEPSRYQDGVGLLSLILTMLVFNHLLVLRTHPEELARRRAHELATAAEKAEANKAAAERAKSEAKQPRTRLEKALIAFGVFVIIGNALHALSLTKPNLIGTPWQAAVHYIYDEIYDLQNKRGLDYYLSSHTKISIDQIEEKGDGAEAQLTSGAPVLPYVVSREEAQTRAALNRYLSLPYDQHLTATIHATLAIKRHGLMGWKVTSNSVDTSTEALTQALQDGIIQGARRKWAAFQGVSIGLTIGFRDPNQNLMLLLSTMVYLIVLQLHTRIYAVLLGAVVLTIIPMGNYILLLPLG